MENVSCRLVHLHLEYLKSRGINKQGFLEKLQNHFPDDVYLRASFLNDPSNRIPWNSFVAFHDEIKSYLAEPSARDDFFDFVHNSQTAWFPYLTAIAGIVWSPTQLYRINNSFFGPSIFGTNVQHDFRTLPDGRLEIRLELAPQCRSNLLFFQLSHNGLKKLPKFLALPDAVVESEITARSGVYLISPPPSTTIWARVTRTLRLLLNPMKVLEELSQQDSALQRNYEKLLKSDTELRMVRAELESRVFERTQALERANEKLSAKVDELMRKEEENRQLYERLNHLQKLESLGTLTGGISHEINNVLHGVFLAVNLADSLTEASHPAKEKISTAVKFADRGREQMKQILSFSRKGKVDRRVVEIVPAVREAVKLMRSTLPKNIKIEEDYSAVETSSVSAIADITQLQQVIINLFSNAAHAMRKSGGEIRLCLKPLDNSIAICVRDTGEGIAPDVIGKIFEPFFTTKPSNEGTGMGLAVVQGIVSAFDGKIQVESQLGEGSEFKIVLPVVSTEAESQLESEDLASLGGNEHILVVDDEPELLELIKDTLLAFGYRVTAASSGSDALNSFIEQTKKGNRVDLVLTDQVMPEMSGLELAARLRQISPEIPIVLCTGFSEHDIASRIGDTKITSCLTKPLDAMALNESIRDSIQRAPASED